jgi:hypothetical protein
LVASHDRGFGLKRFGTPMPKGPNGARISLKKVGGVLSVGKFGQIETCSNEGVEKID